VSLEFDDQGATSKKVFLLDSQTGRVWRYQPLTVVNGKIGGPEIFIPIEIWEANEGSKVLPGDKINFAAPSGDELRP
jgi:hypothetical protein